MLQLHNSLSGRKEEFISRQPGRVGLYVCGVTVYDYSHLGHARFLLVFDMVVRHLKSVGYAVDYVRNITDVDDKIIRRAQQNGETPQALTERYTQYFHEDCAALDLLPPTNEPRATVHMPQILAMIQRLIDRGHAYAAANGDVYFAVASFDEYGRLSGKRLDELRVGARIAPDEAKRDPLDFVLWKACKPGEPHWDSPWGTGRPGWHIECSAMSTHCLGAEFDLHGGGMDLKFPHHENEIAQSCCATGAGFARYWLHNGFVQVGAEKMSKSLGNFATIRELLTQYSGEDLRYFILASHYRSPLIYTREALDAARTSLRRWYNALADVVPTQPVVASEFTVRFLAAMNDDFNTPQAFAVLHEMATRLNSAKRAAADEAGALAGEFASLAGRLGLLTCTAAQREATAVDGLDVAAIETAIEQRVAAKAAKDYALADQIREQLAVQGVLLEDGPAGTQWRRDPEHRG